MCSRLLRCAQPRAVYGGSLLNSFLTVPCCLLAEVGAPGGGGEYEVVAGFGWTNGVALSLLDTYGFRA